MAKVKSTLFLTLLVLALTMPSFMYANAYSNVSSKDRLRVLYEFDGFGLLAYDNFTPITVQYRNTNMSVGVSYIIDARNIIKYIEGTSFHNDVLRLLKGIDRIVVETSCRYNAGASVRVLRENNALRIEVPGGPCTTDPLPVVLKVKGRVYVVHNSTNATLVKIVINATLPLAKGWEIVADSEAYWVNSVCGSVKGNVEGCAQNTLLLISPLYRIENGDVYEGSKKIGNFLPFYITFPRNATEVKYALENKVELQYYSFNVEITMVKYLKKFAKYGEMPEVREVSEIVASLINPLYVSQLEAAIQSLSMPAFTKIKYFEPMLSDQQSGMTGSDLTPVYDLVVDALLGKNPRLSYVEASSQTLSPYVESMWANPLPVVKYIYSYPTSLNLVPLKVSINNSKNNTSHFVLYLYVNNIEYNEIDPYSINIGYYGDPSREDGCKLCGWTPLVVLASLVMAMLIFYLRKRRKL